MNSIIVQQICCTHCEMWSTKKDWNDLHWSKMTLHVLNWCVGFEANEHTAKLWFSIQNVELWVTSGICCISYGMTAVFGVRYSWSLKCHNIVKVSPSVHLSIYPSMRKQQCFLMSRASRRQWLSTTHISWININMNTPNIVICRLFFINSVTISLCLQYMERSKHTFTHFLLATNRIVNRINFPLNRVVFACCVCVVLLSSLLSHSLSPSTACMCCFYFVYQ